MRLAYLALAAAFAVSAQTPGPEKLTATEVIAVNQVAAEINKASLDAGNVIADIQKTHPGYTFDFRTGQLVKLAPKPVVDTKGDEHHNVVHPTNKDEIGIGNQPPNP